MRGVRFRVLTLIAACGAAAALIPLAGSASAAVPGPGPLVSLRADAPPPVPHGATRLGPLAAQSVLHLDVTLRLPNPDAVKSYIAGLYDKRSPLYHQFLRAGQFGARFGPTLAEVAAVESALRAEGLTPGKVSSNRLAISVTAPAATVAKAFGTTLLRYRLSGGRTAYSNTSAPRVPASAAPYVQGVLGLNDLYVPQSLLARPAGRTGRQARLAPRARLTPAATGPQPCTAATTAAGSFGSFTADQLASYYAMSPLYQAGDLGQGVRVGLVEFEPNSTGDIAAYASCYGVSTSVSYIHVDGGAGTGAGSGEAALDIEDVMGLAPDAAIDVYQAPNGGSTNTFDMYNTIVTDDTDQVVSTSWGLCELDSDPTLITDEQSLFEQAASQGQTVLAAAGDDGSTDCLRNGTANAGSLAVDDPASQPYVVGVGGTSIGPTSESTWNDSGLSEGAGGGGVSAHWCMPTYQDQAAIPGLINSDSQTNTTGCGTTDPYIRQVPDLSADADPQTGYTIYLSGSWTAIGGTSAAAPLWASVAALIDASPFCSAYGTGPVGVFPSALYQMVAADHSYIYGSTEGLSDVTNGNNDYSPSGYTGGLYPATAGYDMATGLGTPLVAGFSSTGPSMFYPGLAGLMCGSFRTKLKTISVTRVSPAAGPSTRATTVTVTGTGFLPIAGADMALVGTRLIPASCTSTTRCTVRLPATKPSTVSIRISAEDFAPSAATKASQFRFVAAPTVRSLSPARGTHRGGTRITIRGTNFIGVTAVHFGSKRGTSIRVVSATEIIVTAPAGSGTVSVTVTAAGGTSKVTTATHYKYT